MSRLKKTIYLFRLNFSAVGRLLVEYEAYKKRYWAVFQRYHLRNTEPNFCPVFGLKTTKTLSFRQKIVISQQILRIKKPINQNNKSSIDLYYSDDWAPAGRIELAFKLERLRK